MHCHDVSLWAYKVRHLKVMLASFLANKKNIVLNQIRDASKIGLFTAYIFLKNAGGLTAISCNLCINLLIEIFSCCPICIDLLKLVRNLFHPDSVYQAILNLICFLLIPLSEFSWKKINIHYIMNFFFTDLHDCAGLPKNSKKMFQSWCIPLWHLSILDLIIIKYCNFQKPQALLPFFGK